MPVLDGRLVKRANSCWRSATPGVDAGRGRDAGPGVLRRRDRPVLAQVEAGSEADSAPSAAGWTAVPGGDADFLLASVSRALRS